MTDARLPERYLMDRRVRRLSDSAFRSFVMALLWSVSNRTDGEILPEDLELIPAFAAGSPVEIVEHGLWEEKPPRGWTILDYPNTQTSRHDLEVLENARRRDRTKKARQRREAKQEDPVPQDIPGDVSPGTTQERKGKDRTGKALSRTDQLENGGEVRSEPLLPDPGVSKNDTTRSTVAKNNTVEETFKVSAPSTDGKAHCSWCRDEGFHDMQCPHCHRPARPERKPAA